MRLVQLLLGLPGEQPRVLQLLLPSQAVELPLAAMTMMMTMMTTVSTTTLTSIMKPNLNRLPSESWSLLNLTTIPCQHMRMHEQQHQLRRLLSLTGPLAVVSCSHYLVLGHASLLMAQQPLALALLAPWARWQAVAAVLQRQRLLRRASCTSCHALSLWIVELGGLCGCARCRRGTTTAAVYALWARRAD